MSVIHRRDAGFRARFSLAYVLEQITSLVKFLSFLLSRSSSSSAASAILVVIMLLLWLWLSSGSLECCFRLCRCRCAIFRKRNPQLSYGTTRGDRECLDLCGKKAVGWALPMYITSGGFGYLLPLY